VSQANMFQPKPVFKKFLPVVVPVEGCEVPTFEWDIPHTIPQLGYLVHSHYRYYGKFPSVVAGQILEQYPPPTAEHYVFDNFCGSGTTLVEAKLRGIASVGLDISWLSALASNIKVQHVNFAAVRALQSKIVTSFPDQRESCEVADHRIVKKWFTDEAARDLTALQNLLLQHDRTPERDFLLVAFIAIVRRVSKAYDGEVRPHINKSKKERPVLAAYSKKVRDMLRDHEAFQGLTDSATKAECVLGDNRALPDRLSDGKCYLVVSHPPYLNSFNYSSVFSLEFFWGAPFEPTFAPGREALHRSELKAHPANESIVERYMNHLRDCYAETFRIQRSGGRLAVVIGDCTRLKALIPVVDMTIEAVKALGYEFEQANFRTTHYGLGKYAYSHRADYHGNEAVKRDGILVFRKP
jgi:hypothetical protein